MDREEIVAGLKAGRALHMDGAATEQERNIVQSLIDEGIAESRFCEEDQYGYYRITLSQSENA